MLNTWTDCEVVYNDLTRSWVKRFSVNFLYVGQGARLGHKPNQGVCRTSESRMRTWMTVYHPTRRWVKQVGGDGDDDSMDDDEHDNEVLEENRSGPEEEEEEEE